MGIGVKNLNLNLMNCWRLNVDKSESLKLQKDPVLTEVGGAGGGQTAVSLLQGLSQVLRVKMAEKYPQGSGRERGK